MATPSEISATSPEFSDEAIIAGELVARGRGGARWIAGLLAGTGGAGLILPGAVAWLYLSVPMTADIAIDRQQSRILAEAEAAMGDPVAVEAVAARHGDEMRKMARDLVGRMNPSTPLRKFLAWNARYRFAEITGSDPQESAQAVKDFDANLQQVAAILRLKE